MGNKLNLRIQTECEYHDLLDKDFGRFTIQDLEDFVLYLNSDKRVKDQENLFPDKMLYEVLSDGFNLFDIVNFLKHKRNGKTK